ncbi:MAG TPA: asparagine synthase (glutamine-hydrolyzing) [Nitrospirota bacterium]|nr:asparagine synthase (glutamine-hydrolyzing) [Nitrospirota bacterium]
MCGIVGVFSTRPGWSLSAAELSAMRDTMQHRGPDDAGTYVTNEGGFYAGLGHRRLSIIDLSPLGRQPMSTADGRLWVTFNGEIFNFQSLREELEKTGKYSFRSKTDTEVILHAVHEWGLEGALRCFRGMFAFALYDRQDHSLTLVRDRLGIKPLYYSNDNGIVAFASEIKAILALPDFGKKIDQQGLFHYLTFANTPAPGTIFHGVQKLEAGTYLKFEKNGNARRVRYWDPSKFGPDNFNITEKDCIEETRRLLRQAVARRMVSDVPFGVFLSGGLDSSLNVALMAEIMDRPVQAFTVGIEGDPSNEFVAAHRTAQHFKADHHELFINDMDFISFLPKLPYYQDEPLADPVCVPLYYLSKLARDAGTPVIQIGEGSDEIFAGYGMYHKFDRVNRYFYQYFLETPAVLRSCFYRTARNMLTPYAADMFRRASCNEPLFTGNAIAFWDEEKRLLLKSCGDKTFSSAYIKQLKTGGFSSDSISSIIQIELKNRLPELLLMRVDKMSMAHAIETRVPFLDEDLVEFALTIPLAMKQRNGTFKYILKKAAEGILPHEIIYRNKWGFCGSATNMVTPRIVKFARDVIFDSNLIKELFNVSYIENIFNSHERNKRFNSFKLWNLLNLALWHNYWFKNV